MVSVPLVKNSPVNVAVPANPAGSAAAPCPIKTSAESSGSPGRSATITRKPFSSRVSFRGDKFVSCDAEGGGGVSTPPIAKAD